ncbi:MAG: hypothetical protein ABI995_02700 [Acidobacteriota bacterium]
MTEPPLFPADEAALTDLENMVSTTKQIVGIVQDNPGANSYELRWEVEHALENLETYRGANSESIFDLARQIVALVRSYPMAERPAGFNSHAMEFAAKALRVVDEAQSA